MIVAGVGFRNGATSSDIVEIIQRAQHESRRAASSIAAPSFKAQHESLQAASIALGLPLIVVEPARLVQDRCVTRSEHAAKATGFASVAEACALAALDDRAVLILTRIAGAQATCALAHGDWP